MRWAVIFLTSLWRIVGNPPYGQLGACSTVKVLSQTRCDGSSGGPYCRQSASRKAPLLRSCSVIGRAVSHVEAPVSWAISTAFYIELVSRWLASSI